jgi:hypothetical protein
MMHNSLTIKNLSIALDALGHVCGAEDHFERTKDLLMDEIKAAEETNTKAYLAKKTETPTDDDIPF